MSFSAIGIRVFHRQKLSLARPDGRFGEIFRCLLAGQIGENQLILRVVAEIQISLKFDALDELIVAVEDRQALFARILVIPGSKINVLGIVVGRSTRIVKLQRYFFSFAVRLYSQKAARSLS